MPYYHISVPADNNQLYYAFCLAALLPLRSSNDPNKFERYIEISKILFGGLTNVEQHNLSSHLMCIRNNTMPDVLTKYINEKLRPILSRYISTHATSETNELIPAIVQDINHGGASYDEDIINALSSLTKLTAVRSVWQNHPFNSAQIYLDKRFNRYQFLIAAEQIECLDIRQNLHPNMHPLSARGHNQIIDDYIQNDTQHALRQFIRQFETLVHNLARPANTENYIHSVHDLFFRDAFIETQLICQNLKQIALSTFYTLCLKNPDNHVILDNVLYINTIPGGFEYTLRDSKHHAIITNQPNQPITYEELGLNSDDFVEQNASRELLQPHLSSILDILKNRHRIKLKPAQYRLLISGVTIFIYSLALGALSSAAIVSLHDWTDNKDKNWEIFSTQDLGIGFVITVVCLISSIFGKSMAYKYELALNSAYQQLHTLKFTNAIELLEKQLNANSITQTARNLFLNTEHHVLAHFIIAVCEAKRIQNQNQNQNQNLYAKAVKHYQLAITLALSARIPSVAFKAQLLFMALIQQQSITYPEAETQKILEDLSQYEYQSFTDIFWQLNDFIKKGCEQLLSDTPVDRNLIKMSEDFLSFKNNSILKYFAQPYGQDEEIYILFFQALILSFFAYKEENLIKQEILNSVADDTREPGALNNNEVLPSEYKLLLLKLCERKLRQCLCALQANNRNIEFIENFILNFNCLNDNATAMHADVIRLQNDYLNESIDFIHQLEQDFNLYCIHLEDFLNQIIQHSQDIMRIRANNGCNILHTFSELPFKQDLKDLVVEAALQLEPLKHMRNEEANTPMDLLLSNDPYELKKHLVKVRGEEFNTGDIYYSVSGRFDEQGILNTSRQIFRNHSRCTAIWHAIVDESRLYYVINNGTEVGTIHTVSISNGPVLTAHQKLQRLDNEILRTAGHHICLENSQLDLITRTTNFDLRLHLWKMVIKHEQATIYTADGDREREQETIHEADPDRNQRGLGGGGRR